MREELELVAQAYSGASKFPWPIVRREIGRPAHVN